MSHALAYQTQTLNKAEIGICSSKKLEMDFMDEEGASSPMFPPEFPAQKLETRRYSKEEWNLQRPIIEGMYPLKGMTLRVLQIFWSRSVDFTLRKLR
jgi:hypothetical protein